MLPSTSSRLQEGWGLGYPLRWGGRFTPPPPPSSPALSRFGARKGRRGVCWRERGQQQSVLRCRAQVDKERGQEGARSQGDGDLDGVSLVEDDKEVTALSTLREFKDYFFFRFSELEGRYQVILGIAVAFVICNMDRVNISVAVIPMSADYGWTPTQAGLIQSAFFYGYLVAQLPGGWLANKFGGEKVLPFGVFLWSAATFAVPFLTGDTGALYLSRAAVGLGEGISPPAAVDIIAKRVPVNERSRATTFVFGSMHVGTISGLLIAPALIKMLGWPSVFIVFGAVGVIWCFWFESFFSKNEERLNMEMEASTGAEVGNGNDSSAASTVKEKIKSEQVPWGAIAKSTPIRALTYIHFCNNWAQYSILAWLPTFYKDELGMKLHEAAQLSLLPALAGIAVSFFAAPLADNLVEGGMPVTHVRKIMQGVAFAAPAGCMLACMAGDEHLVTWLLPLGIGFQAFSLAGLYCNHQDISPKYASILSGTTHLFASLPGVFGVPFTGWLLDHTGSWSISLFVPCLFFYISGILVYTKWGSGEEIAFE
ncbi:MFS general substrate transporter [Chloropicon primus]|uniref:MFS general substrate transporter n=2 Tax=Chloropicon primus TaxID=1764295 RepID=A0A5B8MVR8_9CHLO|nr:MFS general substrate transporter [Chloropicon primus]UPR02815.1 MFS general substrate transporter [Chloropicon primus]|eukprot:QDZ23602.1 MFS general substrate transporter [Chloropicon primus]